MGLKPDEILEDWLGKGVTVDLGQGNSIKGVLTGYDDNLNIEVNGTVIRGTQVKAISRGERSDPHLSSVEAAGDSSISEPEATDHSEKSEENPISGASVQGSDAVEETSFQDLESVKQQKFELRELRRKAMMAASDDPVRDVSGSVGSKYVRASAIKEYAKARADGFCEYCGDSSPFMTVEGDPYLEVHHVDELGEGGSDHPDKVVALCPSCHREIHHGIQGENINRELKELLKKGLVGTGEEKPEP